MARSYSALCGNCASAASHPGRRMPMDRWGEWTDEGGDVVIASAVGALGDGTARLLRENVSRQGRRVALALEQGRYTGARPYYSVTYFRKDSKRAQVQRFTPFLERAETLFSRLLRDVTHPGRLGSR